MADLIKLFSISEPEFPSGLLLTFTAREVLAFRLSPAYDNFMAILSAVIRKRDTLNLNEILRILSILCLDFDFAYQFGAYGGHLLLKRAAEIDEVIENCESVIASILQSGCCYPMPKDIAHKENISQPLRYSFETGVAGNHAIDIILRQVPASMHGEGQAAVGYIIWSAAIIMGRWMARNASIFRRKRVLEIGAGIGLCGIVAAGCQASSVYITDYSEIILENIACNIALNRGSYLLNCGDVACIPAEDCRAEVWRLDWDLLLDRAVSSADLAMDDKASSFSTLPPPQTQEEKFDVIVASDMVCCEGDAVGVARCVSQFLAHDGVAIFVIPTTYHRYGIVSVVPRLREAGLHVFMRYLSHSSCQPVAHNSDPTGGDLSVRKPCACCSQYHMQVLECMYEPPDADILTHGLPETEYYEWILIIAMHQ